MDDVDHFDQERGGARGGVEDLDERLVGTRAVGDFERWGGVGIQARRASECVGVGGLRGTHLLARRACIATTHLLARRACIGTTHSLARRACNSNPLRSWASLT